MQNSFLEFGQTVCILSSWAGRQTVNGLWNKGKKPIMLTRKTQTLTADSSKCPSSYLNPQCQRLPHVVMQETFQPVQHITNPPHPTGRTYSCLFHRLGFITSAVMTCLMLSHQTPFSWKYPPQNCKVCYSYKAIQSNSLLNVIFFMGCVWRHGHWHVWCDAFSLDFPFTEASPITLETWQHHYSKHWF